MSVYALAKMCHRKLSTSYLLLREKIKHVLLLKNYKKIKYKLNAEHKTNSELDLLKYLGFD